MGRSYAVYRSRRTNPGGAIPRNKWVKGQVMVTSSGKIQFRTSDRAVRRRNPESEEYQTFLEKIKVFGYSGAPHLAKLVYRTVTPPKTQIAKIRKFVRQYEAEGGVI
jgi:hypothetical protein